MPKQSKAEALRLITQLYSDFGPTLAAEKLQKNHQLTLSVETVRQLMILNHMWVPKIANPKKVHMLRARRPCLGELILIDGSIEHWFEDRGPKCVLLVFIDDATSCIGKLWFTPTEDLEAYFHAVGDYLYQYGRPLAFYSDRHAVFNVGRKSKNPLTGEEEGSVTQFERAMTELDIKLIHAHSPQAKGRVERCNRTLQDRFIKELRLKGISDIETGNAFAEEYRLEHNKHFGVLPAQSSNLHRPLERHHNLEKILKPNHHRIIQKDLSFQYESEIYQVRWEPGLPRSLGEKIIVVWTDDNGHVHGQYEGIELHIELFKHLLYQPVITQKTAKLWIMRKPRYRPNKEHPYKKNFKIN